MNSCDFCEKIYDRKEFDDLWHESPWDYMGTYLIRQESGEITIFSSLDDWYYSSTVVHNVKYCPCCGKAF